MLFNKFTPIFHERFDYEGRIVRSQLLCGTFSLAEIWAAALGAATAATSIGLTASGALNPSQPNLASSSAAISNANAAMLPIQRKLAAQANLGKLGGKQYAQFGGVQTQAALAKQNAEKQLALQKTFAPQFIDEALKQQQLANPEGVAARDRESQLIQQQIDHPATNPIGEMLESQILPQVQAGKGLDDFDTSVLNGSVEDALKARGGSTVAGDFTSPLTTGFAGENRRLAGLGAGQQFLSSGATPEDVKYRQQQQDLANLSAEVSGATPTSEFGSISGASRSANPVSFGAPLPTSNNSIQEGGNAALNNYGAQMGQANNWLAGLSTVNNLGGAINQFTR